MAADFGLLVARYNTSTPNYSADNDLRELRIDSGGRLRNRATDDRDMSLRYFYDGEAVDGSPNNDRGILVLGKNDTDSNYQALRLNDDGSLVVSFSSGTDASAAADDNGGVFSATDVRGEIPLTVGNWVLVQSIAVASGKIHIDGWSFSSDKNTEFQVCLTTSAGTPVRSETTKIFDTQLTTSARPSDHVNFNRAITQASGTNFKLCIFAKQLQSGAAGVAMGMLNVHTTT